MATPERNDVITGFPGPDFDKPEVPMEPRPQKCRFYRTGVQWPLVTKDECMQNRPRCVLRYGQDCEFFERRRYSPKSEVAAGPPAANL